jgi:hypothetical protein
MNERRRERAGWFSSVQLPVPPLGKMIVKSEENVMPRGREKDRVAGEARWQA